MFVTLIFCLTWLESLIQGECPFVHSSTEKTCLLLNVRNETMFPETSKKNPNIFLSQNFRTCLNGKTKVFHRIRDNTPRTQSQKWNPDIVIWFGSNCWGTGSSTWTFSCPSNILNFYNCSLKLLRIWLFFFLSIQQPHDTNTKCKAYMQQEVHVNWLASSLSLVSCSATREFDYSQQRVEIFVSSKFTV